MQSESELEGAYRLANNAAIEPQLTSLRASEIATVTLGAVAYPLLARSGYSKNAAGGLLAAGGLGAIISPPVLGAAAFLLLPSTAMAQEGQIAGTVRDPSGAVIPGVLVEATSPALDDFELYYTVSPEEIEQQIRQLIRPLVPIVPRMSSHPQPLDLVLRRKLVQLAAGSGIALACTSNTKSLSIQAVGRVKVTRSSPPRTRTSSHVSQ